MTTSLFDDPSMPSFQDYPAARPFLNSNTPSSGKPVKAFPESNSQAVLSALKGLQEKIYNLELDRSKAEKNLKALAAETTVYKDLLTQSHKTPTKTSGASASASPQLRETFQPKESRPVKQTTEIEVQLRNADTRCRLLERQLENMRKMVQVAEKERGDALEKQVALERERGRITAENRDTQARLTQLEKLTGKYEDLASRKIKSDVKVKELLAKLQVEEHQRKLLSDKAAQFQTEAETKRILLQHEIPERDVPRPPKKKLTKKKKKASQSKERPASQPQVRKQAGQPHYRLNLADIPFVTGTSTSPSHAVSANMQRLLHDLKHHSPLYCNEDFIHGRRQLNGDSPDMHSDGEADPRGRSERRYSSSTEEDLTDLMVALQDEFGKMTFDHQVLVKQIASTVDKGIRSDLERQLDTLVGNMELKGEQIATVRRHRVKLGETKRKEKKVRTTAVIRPVSVPRRARSRNQGNSASPGTTRGARPSVMRNRRLEFLRDVRQVHSALRKDDLSWD